jgi:hypothetical protein
MKKIHVLGLALLTIFLFSSAITTASAFAEDEFLFNAEAISGTEESLPTETGGEILIEDMATGLDRLCSFVIDGYVGPGGHTLITKILNLLKEEELLPGTTIPSVSCLDHSEGGVKCVPGAELMETDILNLPLLGRIVLVEGAFVDLIESGGTGKLTYITLCVELGLEVEVICEAEPGATLTNETSGVLVRFEENETMNPPGSCSDSGKLLIIGEGLMVDTSTGTLTVS